MESFLLYLCLFQVRYDNKLVLTQNKIGSLSYNFENLFDKGNAQFREIQLNYMPNDLCILPNGQFLISSSTSQFIKVLSNQFKVIKTIEKMNNTKFAPRYITSNGSDKVYFTEGDRVIQTDMNLKFIKEFGRKGSGVNEFNFPLGITHHENSIYVCDSFNQRIQKLSEDLVFEDSYPLNFKPWTIKIVNKVNCCIGPNGGSFIFFYNLNPFYFKTKVNGWNGDICSYFAHFYIHDSIQQKITCYDVNGKFVKEKELMLETAKDKENESEALAEEDEVEDEDEDVDADEDEFTVNDDNEFYDDCFVFDDKFIFTRMYGRKLQQILF